MLTLQLSSPVLEVPNDANSTLSRNFIGCSTLSQVLQAEWLYLENIEKGTLNISMTHWKKKILVTKWSQQHKDKHTIGV